MARKGGWWILTPVILTIDDEPQVSNAIERDPRMHVDREYRIACDADERRQLLDAADYLDQQMRQVKEGMNLPGSEKVAVLAALNITNDLLAARNG